MRCTATPRLPLAGALNVAFAVQPPAKIAPVNATGLTGPLSTWFLPPTFTTAWPCRIRAGYDEPTGVLCDCFTKTLTVIFEPARGETGETVTRRVPTVPSPLVTKPLGEEQ